MSKKIRILGVDPALRNTGLAVAEVDIWTGDWNVVDLILLQTEKGKDGKTVRKSSDDLRRCKVLYDGLQEALKLWAVNMAISEVPTGAQSASASFSNGLSCMLLASIPVPLIQVNPTEVKMASVGHKYGAKEEIIEWATKRWPDLPWLRRRYKGADALLNDNEHLADACATIAAGLKTDQFKQATELMRAAYPLAA